MKPAIRILPHLAASLLSWYALTVFILMIIALVPHDPIGWGWAVWLGWPIALTTGAMVGTRLRLLTASRLFFIWPAGRRNIGRAVLLILLIGCLPGWLLVFTLPTGWTALVMTTTLALAGLTIGLRLSINGVMWTVIMLMLANGLMRGGLVAWLLQSWLSAALLAVFGVLAWSSWRMRTRIPTRDDPGPGRLRLLLRDRPGQPLGWRLLVAYLAFGLLVILLSMGPLLDWNEWTSPDLFNSLRWSLTFISTVLIALTAAHDLFIYRASLRFYLPLPGEDRDQLRRRAETGLFRAWLILGALPQLGLILFAACTGAAPLADVAGSALLILAMLTTVCALVLWMLTAGSHIAAVASLLGLALLAILVMPLLVLVWIDSLNGERMVLISPVFLAATMLLGQQARKAWRQLSLERIDHWPLVKLARQSSFG